MSLAQSLQPRITGAMQFPNPVRGRGEWDVLLWHRQTAPKEASAVPCVDTVKHSTQNA